MKCAETASIKTDVFKKQKSHQDFGVIFLFVYKNEKVQTAKINFIFCMGNKKSYVNSTSFVNTRGKFFYLVNKTYFTKKFLAQNLEKL